MSVLIEKDEATAGRRRVPFRLFTSNGTAPDTGASNDSVIMGVLSATTIVPDVLVVASNANQGMYYITLNQSDVSVLGAHPIYHTQGDFPQHVANVEVVQFNPYSRSSAFTSADSVGLKAVTHSGATVRGVENYSNFSGTLSNVTVQVSGGTVAGVTNKVDIRDGTYSAVTVRGLENWSNLSGAFSALSVRLDDNAAAPGVFQAGAIDAVGFDVMNLSDVTVRVHPMNYSGLTVEGLNNYSNLSGSFSNLSVQVSGGTVTGVTNIVQSNLTTIFGNREAVIRLLSHLSSVVTGVAVAGQLSTTTMTSDVAEATDDHYNDRVIVFLTGALAGQATSITSYFGLSATSSRFVFPALTEAPTADDEFVVV